MEVAWWKPQKKHPPDTHGSGCLDSGIGGGPARRLVDYFCDLAAHGLVIFSGCVVWTRPVHRGAIAAKGKTVAVFSTGVDGIYPKENSHLVENMLAFGGALVSEFPLNTFPAPQNFPIRHRIISGLSVGGLVVEAGRSRQGHYQQRMGTQYAHEAGCQAGGDVGRHMGGTAHRCEA